MATPETPPPMKMRPIAGPRVRGARMRPIAGPSVEDAAAPVTEDELQEAIAAAAAFLGRGPEAVRPEHLQPPQATGVPTPVRLHLADGSVVDDVVLCGSAGDDGWLAWLRELTFLLQAPGVQFAQIGAAVYHRDELRRVSRPAPAGVTGPG